MLQPLEQCGHTEETFVSSQGRALNRKSLLVSAPTGQMSAMFPASSFSIILPSTVPMKVCSPRFSTAISSKPATSLQRFTHRMQNRGLHARQRTNTVALSGYTAMEV